ncbi:MAG: threonine synthase [Bacillota bacterium]
MEKLISSRNSKNEISYFKAILQGIAKDGGLFIPKNFNKIDFNNKKFIDYNYHQFAFLILKNFLKDIPDDDLNKMIKNAYDNKFDTDEIVPIKKINDSFFIELFHGPTLAFKDMALSILPYLMKYSKKEENLDKDILILTATSGDTGKAALEGFKNINGIKIIVFYPKNGVSDIQAKQMKTQVGKNVKVLGIDGNFDDAQNSVKEIFNDSKFKSKLLKQNYILSSANSINIGRLLPQIIYYVSSYFKLIKKEEITLGEKVDVVVPTGNFGNILAAKYAKKLGLPIGKLICASNENNVLTDFINSGTYNINRNFKMTYSPSMDILISSNLERLLYHISNNNSEKINNFMTNLNKNKKYTISKKLQNEMKDFEGHFCSQKETLDTIKKVYEKYNYLIDPHTAVAYCSYKKSNTNNKTLIASTAHPFKFPKAISKALKLENNKNVFELLKEIEKRTDTKIPERINNLTSKKTIHNKTIKIEDIKKNIISFL